MFQPSGFIDKEKPDFVFKLQRAIYGLKQAPRAWYKELSNFLLQFGFVNTLSNPSIFVYTNNSCLIYFLVYVDDLIVTGNNDKFILEFIVKLATKFSYKELGDLSYFLGIEVLQKSDGMFLTQRKYILDLIDKFSI